MNSHLTERIAEFVFGELSEVETAEGRRHLTDCAACRLQVEQFQHTHAMLKTSAEVEPPRRIIFEAEKGRFTPWVWRWLAPMAASAAVALAVVTLAPQPPVVERFVQQPAPTAAAAAQPVDYEKVISDLRAEQQTWLAGELQKRDAAQAKEFQRVRGEIDWLAGVQRAAYRETADVQRSIQLLAQATVVRE